jgi:hypothetical protein
MQGHPAGQRRPHLQALLAHGLCTSRLEPVAGHHLQAAVGVVGA